MIAFICYFFPAILSLWLFETLSKQNISLKKCIYRFCLNSVLINFLCFATKKFVLHTDGAPMLYEGADMIPSTAFNYIVMAIFFTLILVVLEILISKNVKVIVEDNNDEAKK